MSRRPARRIDRLFVINLDRRQDRLRSFYGSVPFDGVERFAAEDGKALELTDEIATLFRGNRFRFRRGVVGCALSHYRLWRKVAAPSYRHEVTAIFEDDVQFSALFPSLWNESVADELPADFDLCYLGGIPLWEAAVREQTGADGGLEIDPGQYVGSMLNPWFGVPDDQHFCTCSYLLSRKGARKLCRFVDKAGIQLEIDHQLIEFWPRLRVCVTVPLFCWSILHTSTDVQQDFTSLV